MIKILQVLLSLSVAVSDSVKGQGLEPNPPNWDTNKVKIMQLDSPDENQKIVDEIFKEVGGFTETVDVIGQFSDKRYVIMFMPGEHPTKVNVGFYTQVLGLGMKPDQTKVANVTSPNGSHSHTLGALCNFWRGVENLYVSDNMTWAVSQAVSLRRLEIDGNLVLYEVAQDGEVGYGSGGFMADLKVHGYVDSGPQQQWLTRNSEIASFKGSNYNLVFSGVVGAPPTHCGNKEGGPYTTLWKTDIIAEKPYVVFKENRYILMVPKLEKDKLGITTFGWEFADEVDFELVFVAHENNTAAEINAKLAAGLRVVFQPGIYNLSESLKVNQEGAVLLGLGMATLVPTNGNPCIEVGDVDNVRIGGLLLQAGQKKSDSLLIWGKTKDAGDPNLPGVLSDVYVRAGGPEHQKVTPTSCGTMVTINRAFTIIDNTWLWRADHDVDGNVANGANPSDVGLVVNGDNVTAYGLMSEHHMTNLVEWNGNYGKTVMYQSEYPYDVNVDYANKSYVSYLVSDDVTHHKGYGIGAYAYFRDYTVLVENAVRVPNAPGIQMYYPFSVFLWGQDGSGIKHVINGKGTDVGMHSDRLTWVCYFDPDLYYGEGSGNSLPTSQEEQAKALLKEETLSFLQ